MLGKYNLKVGLSKQKLTLCFNEDAYISAFNKLGITKPPLNSNGLCFRLSKEDHYDKYIIYINVDLDKFDIYDIKGLLVHELNHLVTYNMDFFNFTDDEYRSVLLSELYVTTMKLLDTYIGNLSEKC